MVSRLIIQPGADRAWSVLEKSDKMRYEKVGHCLHKLSQDPRHPGLRSKRFKSLDRKHAEAIWESYVENKVAAAYRLFWHYGPGKDEIAVL